MAADAFTAAENGSTVQARGDDEYLLPLPLWRTYGQCVARARKCACSYSNLDKMLYLLTKVSGQRPLPCCRASFCNWLISCLLSIAVPARAACCLEGSMADWLFFASSAPVSE